MLDYVYIKSEERLNSDRVFPMTDDQKLIAFLRETAHEVLYESLFQKRFKYTNSLIASVTKSLKSTLVVSNENTLNLIQNDLLSESKRSWVETLYRSYLQPLSYFEGMLRDEQLFVRFQLTSMGRSRDIQTLESKVENDLGYKEVYTTESTLFESLEKRENCESLL